MCVLRTHIKLSVFENIFSEIEKAVITFSILEKMFPKTESLMCALRAHISKILSILLFKGCSCLDRIFFLFQNTLTTYV